MCNWVWRKVDAHDQEEKCMAMMLWAAGLTAACGSVGTAGTTAAQACQGLQVNSTGGLSCPQECATAFQQVRA